MFLISEMVGSRSYPKAPKVLLVEIKKTYLFILMIASWNEELNVKKLFLVILYIFCVYLHAAQLGAAGGMVSSCKVWPVVASSPAQCHVSTLLRYEPRDDHYSIITANNIL